MLFKKKDCPSCTHKYDAMLDYCPSCHERNTDLDEFKVKSSMIFVPTLTQILLAVIGIVGLIVLNIIFSMIFYSTYQGDKILGTMLINSCSYAVLFIVLALLLFPYFRAVFDSFKKAEPYLWGLLGFLILYAGSVLFNIIAQLIYPDIGTGGNQSVATQSVLNYPIISIIILGIIGPMCEEVTYRVGLFSFFRRIHLALAFAIGIILFGIVHFDFTSNDLLTEVLLLPTYLFSGAVFSFLYYKRGLSASLTAHILNNLLSIILILTVPNA